MTFQLQFFGATERVTGSLYLVRTRHCTILLECGLIQGGRAEEQRNREAFPVPVSDDRRRRIEPRAYRSFRSRTAAGEGRIQRSGLHAERDESAVCGDAS